MTDMQGFRQFFYPMTLKPQGSCNQSQTVEEKNLDRTSSNTLTVQMGKLRQEFVTSHSKLAERQDRNQLPCSLCILFL